jgi:hypothetical protein
MTHLEISYLDIKMPTSKYKQAGGGRDAVDLRHGHSQVSISDVWHVVMVGCSPLGRIVEGVCAVGGEVVGVGAEAVAHARVAGIAIRTFNNYV